MCGLAGFCGTNPDFDKLKILGILNQSRGIDSTGICFEFDEPVKVAGFSSGGSFEDLCEDTVFDLDAISEKKRILIHTRKATKGAVNVDNAHPFVYKLDNDVSANFMHNGTISNIAKLKTEFKLSIKSDVDSVSFGEALVNKKYKILSEYEGAAAAAWFYSDKDDEIYLWNGAAETYDRKNLYYERGLFYVQTVDEEGNTSLYFSSEKRHLKIAFGSEVQVKPVPHNNLVIVKDGKISYKKAYSRDDFQYSTYGAGGSTRRFVASTKESKYHDSDDDYRDGSFFGFGTGVSTENLSSPRSTDLYKWLDVDTRNGNIVTTSVPRKNNSKPSLWVYKELARRNIASPHSLIFFDGTSYRHFNSNNKFADRAFGTFFLDNYGIIYTEKEKKELDSKQYSVTECFFYKGILMKLNARDKYSEMDELYSKCVKNAMGQITYYDPDFVAMIHPDMPLMYYFSYTSGPRYELRLPNIKAETQKSIYRNLSEYAVDDYFIFEAKYSFIDYMVKYNSDSEYLSLVGALIPKGSQFLTKELTVYDMDYNAYKELVAIDAQFIRSFQDETTNKSSNKLVNPSFDKNSEASCGPDCGAQLSIETSIKDSVEDVEILDFLNEKEAEIVIERMEYVIGDYDDAETNLECLIADLKELQLNKEGTERGFKLLTSLEGSLKRSSKLTKGISSMKKNYESNFIKEEDMDYFLIDNDDDDYDGVEENSPTIEKTMSEEINEMIDYINNDY